jgi:hypothetical protein
MKFEPNEPPRMFNVGKNGEFTLSDCGRVSLDKDEQVTFVTASGTELDVVRKSWGYYATPSLNKRLRSFGLRSVIVKGATGNTYFLLLVEDGQEDNFAKYLDNTQMKIICWLDSDEACSRLESTMSDHRPLSDTERKCPPHE